MRQHVLVLGVQILWSHAISKPSVAGVSNTAISFFGSLLRPIRNWPELNPLHLSTRRLTPGQFHGTCDSSNGVVSGIVHRLLHSRLNLVANCSEMHSSDCLECISPDHSLLLFSTDCVLAVPLLGGGPSGRSFAGFHGPRSIQISKSRKWWQTRRVWSQGVSTSVLKKQTICTRVSEMPDLMSYVILKFCHRGLTFDIQDVATAIPLSKFHMSHQIRDSKSPSHSLTSFHNGGLRSQDWALHATRPWWS
jgi:hypothetical protein